MTITVADARPQDATVLGAILSDWVDETDWMPRRYSREDEAGFLAAMIAGGGVRVARVAGQILGFIATDAQGIHALYLDAPARGQGVGRVLLADAKSRSGGKTELWTFQKNTRARKFYAREGFVEVEFTDGAGNAENMPDLRLIWEGAA